jgi:hypothetical protein
MLVCKLEGLRDVIYDVIEDSSKPFYRIVFYVLSFFLLLVLCVIFDLWIP